MKRTLSVLAGTILAALASAAQAEPPNVSRAWSAPWAPSNSNDAALRDLKALQDYYMRNPGSNAGGAAGGGTVNNYNGPVSNTYTGPMSSSGSTVTNVQNLNEVAATNSTVTTTQGATGGTQSGAANSNAAVQGNHGTFNPGSNQSPTSN